MIRYMFLWLAMIVQGWEVSGRQLYGNSKPDVMKIIYEANRNVPNLLQGDINVKNGTNYTYHCGNDTDSQVPLWPVKNGTVTIPYQNWGPFFSASMKLMIEHAVRYLNRILRPRFKLIRRTIETSYIRFISVSAGCSSKIGNCLPKDQPQEIKLGPKCSDKGVIAHEILHALGFAHEQSRWDRDNFVTINEENILNGSQYNFAKVPRPSGYPQEVRAHGPRTYDYHSLMHYTRNMFSANGKDTITPKQRGVYIGQQVGLSKHDVQELFQLYGFDIPAVGKLDCDFDHKRHWCHYSHTSGWKIERGKMVNISNHVNQYEDHTYGYGFFAMVDGKQAGNSQNEMVSKVLYSSSPFCVKFAYVMPSFHHKHYVGRLQVLVRYGNNREEVLFDKFGDQGQDWNVAEVQMQPSGIRRQLVVRVTNENEGDLPTGDISIDDIFFDEGKCPPPESKQDKEDYKLSMKNDKRLRKILTL